MFENERIIDTTALNRLIVGRVEPHIYTFSIVTGKQIGRAHV